MLARSSLSVAPVTLARHSAKHGGGLPRGPHRIRAASVTFFRDYSGTWTLTVIAENQVTTCSMSSSVRPSAMIRHLVMSPLTATKSLQLLGEIEVTLTTDIGHVRALGDTVDAMAYGTLTSSLARLIKPDIGGHHRLRQEKRHE